MEEWEQDEVALLREGQSKGFVPAVATEAAPTAAPTAVPGDPELTSMVPGCPWHRRTTSLHPCKETWGVRNLNRQGEAKAMELVPCREGRRLDQPPA